MARMPDEGKGDSSGPNLRLVETAPKASMTPYQVLVVIDAAERIDRAAGVALRIAAVTGARRVEIAALRWDDLDGHRLTIDSSVVVRRDAAGSARFIDSSTTPVRDRTMCVDGITVRMIERLRAEREAAGPYMFSTEAGPPNPDRISRWWQRARDLAGIDGPSRLDELHDSLGATVTHVLDFGDASADPVTTVADPDPVEADHATVEIPPTQRERKLAPRLRDVSLSRVRDLSLPVVVEVTAAIAFVVFVLLHLL